MVPVVCHVVFLWNKSTNRMDVWFIFVLCTNVLLPHLLVRSRVRAPHPAQSTRKAPRKKAPCLEVHANNHLT